MRDEVELKVLGKLMEPYNPATMDWNTYEALLRNVLELHDVTNEAKRKSHIMIMVGMNAFAELHHATNGKDIKALTSEDLLNILRGRYAPKKLVIAQRDRFLSIKQKPSQTLTELMAELQHAAASCEFEKITDAQKARDSYMLQGFLRALRSEETRARILQHENLDFNKAYELACVLEQADKESTKMGKQQENTPTYVGRIERGRNNKRDVECYACGKPGHMKYECNYRDSTCQLCGMRGHIARTCKRDSDYEEESDRVVKTVESSTNNYAYDISDFDTVYYVNRVEQCDPRKRKPRVSVYETSSRVEKTEERGEKETTRSYASVVKGVRKENIVNVSSKREVRRYPCVEGKVNVSSTRGVRRYTCNEEKEKLSPKRGVRRYPRMEKRVKSQEQRAMRPVSAMRIEPEVNGVKVPMILDTGSSETVISTSTWRKIGQPRIEHATRELRDLNGRAIPIVGTCTVPVIYSNRRYVTEVYIHRGDVNILGRSAIRTLMIDLNKVLYKSD